MNSRRRSRRNPMTRQYAGGSPARLRLIQTGHGERSAEALRLHPRRAAPQVVVDQAHGLHEGVDGGRAYERPAPASKIITRRDRLRWDASLYHFRTVATSSPAYRLQVSI